MNQGELDLQTLYNAIQTLYSDSKGISSNEKHSASAYLEEFQKSVPAWSLADQLLYQGQDLNTRYFGAQTLRTKIQNSFEELPPESHLALRDSLLQHISSITSATELSIVNQLCLGVAQMVLQSTSWADPYGQLLHLFGQDGRHGWPLLEILSFIPEEVYSWKLHLGDNRRKQILNQLKDVAPIILGFIKQCLAAAKSGVLVAMGAPVELISTGVLNCYKSWIRMNAEVFCSDRPSEILEFAVRQLQSGRCPMRMHRAAMESICSLIEVLPESESKSRVNHNSARELNSIQEDLFNAVLSFEEAYHNSVDVRDHEKTLNYARIFSAYGESMIDYMLKSWRSPHYSLRAIDLVLICSGHHDYEITEITFSFWYRLADDLYHAHDGSLNLLFRPYVVRFIHSLINHCALDEDDNKPLSSSDEHYDFRKRAAELVDDLLFVVGSNVAFEELGVQLMRPNTGWHLQEAALHLLHTISKSTDPSNTEVVEPVIATVLSWSTWKQPMLRISAVRFIGGMSPWFSNHSEEYLIKAMTFLASSLEDPQISNTAGAALLNMCQLCANQIAPNHLKKLLGLLEQEHTDRYNVDNDAVIGLLRGVGHVIVTLPNEEFSATARKICWAQLQPLNHLIQNTNVNGESNTRNTKADPTYWLDRLTALFRSTGVNGNMDGQPHPCVAAICEDTWPVLSRLCDKYQADSRVMERVCRCLRYAIRSVGKHSHPVLPSLVTQLVSMYQSHRHSCFLYVGSILVDEYGGEPQCVDGLLNMLEAFFTPTYQLLSEPDGLRNNPDTVDDFYKLCSWYIQRCPLQFLKSGILLNILQLSLLGIHLDHRDANSSVFKFLYEMVHQLRREKENDINLPVTRALVRLLLLQHGMQLVQAYPNAIDFSLPFVIGPCDFLEFLPSEFSGWFEAAIKNLPNQSSARTTPLVTIQQLGDFHKQVMSATDNNNNGIADGPIIRSPRKEEDPYTVVRDVKTRTIGDNPQEPDSENSEDDVEPIIKPTLNSSRKIVKAKARNGGKKKYITREPRAMVSFDGYIYTQEGSTAKVNSGVAVNLACRFQDVRCPGTARRDGLYVSPRLRHHPDCLSRKQKGIPVNLIIGVARPQGIPSSTLHHKATQTVATLNREGATQTMSPRQSSRKRGCDRSESMEDKEERRSPKSFRETEVMEV